MKSSSSSSASSRPIPGYDGSRTPRGHHRHGFGRQVFDNQDVYEGEFTGDVPHGRGVWRFSSGAIYQGDFARGEKHGAGKYTYADGSVLEGTWMDGRRVGRGRLTFSAAASQKWRREVDGPLQSALLGTTANPRPSDTRGSGDRRDVEVKEEEETPLNLWETFMRHPSAAVSRFMATPTSYEGEFRDGAPHGPGGIMHYASGCVYMGPFHQGTESSRGGNDNQGGVSGGAADTGVRGSDSAPPQNALPSAHDARVAGHNATMTTKSIRPAAVDAERTTHTVPTTTTGTLVIPFDVIHQHSHGPPPSQAVGNRPPSRVNGSTTALADPSSSQVPSAEWIRSLLRTSECGWVAPPAAPSSGLPGAGRRSSLPLAATLPPAAALRSSNAPISGVALEITGEWASGHLAFQSASSASAPTTAVTRRPSGSATTTTTTLREDGGAHTVPNAPSYMATVQLTLTTDSPPPTTSAVVRRPLSATVAPKPRSPKRIAIATTLATVVDPPAAAVPLSRPAASNVERDSKLCPRTGTTTVATPQPAHRDLLLLLCPARVRQALTEVATSAAGGRSEGGVSSSFRHARDPGALRCRFSRVAAVPADVSEGSPLITDADDCGRKPEAVVVGHPDVATCLHCGRRVDIPSDESHPLTATTTTLSSYTTPPPPQPTRQHAMTWGDVLRRSTTAPTRGDATPVTVGDDATSVTLLSSVGGQPSSVSAATTTTTEPPEVTASSREKATKLTITAARGGEADPDKGSGRTSPPPSAAAPIVEEHDTHDQPPDPNTTDPTSPPFRRAMDDSSSDDSSSSESSSDTTTPTPTQATTTPTTKATPRRADERLDAKPQQQIAEPPADSAIAATQLSSLPPRLPPPSGLHEESRRTPLALAADVVVSSSSSPQPPPVAPPAAALNKDPSATPSACASPIPAVHLSDVQLAAIRLLQRARVGLGLKLADTTRSPPASQSSSAFPPNPSSSLTKQVPIDPPGARGNVIAKGSDVEHMRGSVGVVLSSSPHSDSSATLVTQTCGAARSHDDAVRDNHKDGGCGLGDTFASAVEEKEEVIVRVVDVMEGSCADEAVVKRVASLTVTSTVPIHAPPQKTTRRPTSSVRRESPPSDKNDNEGLPFARNGSVCTTSWLPTTGPLSSVRHAHSVSPHVAERSGGDTTAIAKHVAASDEVADDDDAAAKGIQVGDIVVAVTGASHAASTKQDSADASGMSIIASVAPTALVVSSTSAVVRFCESLLTTATANSDPLLRDDAVTPPSFPSSPPGPPSGQHALTTSACADRHRSAAARWWHNDGGENDSDVETAAQECQEASASAYSQQQHSLIMSTAATQPPPLPIIILLLLRGRPQASSSSDSPRPELRDTSATATGEAAGTMEKEGSNSVVMPTTMSFAGLAALDAYVRQRAGRCFTGWRETRDEENGRAGPMGRGAQVDPNRSFRCEFDVLEATIRVGSTLASRQREMLLSIASGKRRGVAAEVALQVMELEPCPIVPA